LAFVCVVGRDCEGIHFVCVVGRDFGVCVCGRSSL